MWLAADDLAGRAAASVDRGPRPAEAETREGGRGDMPGWEDPDPWQSVGALAGKILDRIKDRAPHIAPCGDARTPAGGSVAEKAGRRLNVRGGQHGA